MLVIPTVVGIVLFAYQLTKFIETGSLMNSIDTPWNAVYGIFLSLWGSIFAESWMKKQKRM